MEVTLTIENSEGKLSTVSAGGGDYDEALVAARALVPEGCRAIAVRTDR
ncbi:hypothetical protein [Arthrobacter sp. cf158]|nr:hypothetical protein [Arthrobacter sp. cf158]